MACESRRPELPSVDFLWMKIRQVAMPLASITSRVPTRLAGTVSRRRASTPLPFRSTLPHRLLGKDQPGCRWHGVLSRSERGNRHVVNWTLAFAGSGTVTVNRFVGSRYPGTNEPATARPTRARDHH